MKLDHRLRRLSCPRLLLFLPSLLSDPHSMLNRSFLKIKDGPDQCGGFEVSFNPAA